MRLLKSTNIVVVIVNFAILCRGAFVPSRHEERKLVNCLLARNGQRHHECKLLSERFRVNEGDNSRSKHQKNTFTPKGSISKNKNDYSDAIREYILVLYNYNNFPHKTTDVTRKAVKRIGSCGRFFESIIQKWKRFLIKRDHMSEMISPAWQAKNGSAITARFNSDETDHRNAEDIKAIDLVIGRSSTEDIEVYGKYLVTVTLHSNISNDVIVHQSLQATCTSNDSRSFVVGFNAAGLQTMSNLYFDQQRNIDLNIELIPHMQIVQAPNIENGRFKRTKFDIGEKVLGIVFHSVNRNTQQIPIRKQMLTLPYKDSRRKRSVTGSCQRESYTMNYDHIDILFFAVLAPTQFDIGECVGSCDDLFLINLNATNHALSMATEKGKEESHNPEASVCCIPITYRNFYYITKDTHGRLMSTYAENMVTDYCGCR